MIEGFDQLLRGLTDAELDAFETQMMICRTDAESDRMADAFAALSSYATRERERRTEEE